MACVINVSNGVVHTVPHKHMRTQARAHTHSIQTGLPLQPHGWHNKTFTIVISIALAFCLVSVAASLHTSPPPPPPPLLFHLRACVCGSAGVVVIR